MSKLFVYPLLLLTFVSCVVTEKGTYLDTSEITTQSSVTFRNKRPVYKIQTDDILSIQVQGQEAGIFNLGAHTNNLSDGVVSQYLKGYMVDDRGYITLPLVGKLSVMGKTLDETQQVIQRSIDNYLRDATAIVKLVNFKVTVLGNVASPGTFYIYEKHANIFEALGMAGDITMAGNKKRVKLLRKNDNGTEAILLDLTNPNIMRSEYFYLLPRDVIYVEPVQFTK